MWTVSSHKSARTIDFFLSPPSQEGCVGGMSVGWHPLPATKVRQVGYESQVQGADGAGRVFG